MLSTGKYCIPNPSSFSFLMYTVSVEVSRDELLIINFWSKDPSCVNCFVKNVPSYISTLLNDAVKLPVDVSWKVFVVFSGI